MSASATSTETGGVPRRHSGECAFDFEDDDWSNVTPRLALQRWIGERTQVYGQWARGFRTGGG